MKLATFRAKGGGNRVGVVSNAGSIVDIQEVHRAVHGAPSPMLTDMLSLIASGPDGLALVTELTPKGERSAQHVHDIHDVVLMSPLPEPRQLRDFSVFERHLRDAPLGLRRIAAREAGLPEPEGSGDVAEIYRRFPLFYFSNRLNVAGHLADVPWPRGAQLLDFELEIGVVIGRTGKAISPGDASKHIFGYTIFNDVSARDVQHRQMLGGLGPCKAKSYDGCNVLGPWIVTADEIPDPYNLAVRVLVNGETWVATTTQGMIHRFDEMIAFASEDETIFAGEVFGSGTVGGCCGLELDRWIRKGDVVDLEVDGIGRLTNRYG